MAPVQNRSVPSLSANRGCESRPGPHDLRRSRGRGNKSCTSRIHGGGLKMKGIGEES